MAEQVNTIQSIVEWGKGLPQWQSDALRRVFITGSLTDEEKKEILQMAKKANGIVLASLPPTPVPFTSGHASGVTQSQDEAILLKIQDVKNVNALAAGEALVFSPKGVTVVYGDNGSGKSGYSRILKRACRARYTEEILPNVLGSITSSSSPKATFVIQGRKEGSEIPLIWREGDVTPDQLTQIAVFDTQCARVFVDESNEVRYIPYGLDVFPKLAELFDELKEQLVQERNALLQRDEVLQGLVGDHQVGKIIERLSANTDINDVEGLAALSEEEKLEHNQLRVAVKTLEVNNPVKKAASIRLFKSRVIAQGEKLQEIMKSLDGASCVNLKEAWELAKIKAEAAKLASANQFEKEPLPGVGSDAWREMFRMAQNYSVQYAYPDDKFPVTGEGSYCPLCMQSLDTTAQDRLRRFQKYIEDVAEKAAKESKATLIKLFQPIKDLRIDDIEQTTVEEIRGKNEAVSNLLKETPAQMRVVKNAWIEAVRTGVWDSLPEIQVNVLDELKTIIESLENEAKLQDALVKPEEQSLLKKKYTELHMRWKLGQHKSVVVDYIRCLSEAEKLRVIIVSLNSHAVSTKNRELLKKILTSELQDTLDRELKGFDVNYINLNLKPSSPKGHSKHKLQMTDANHAGKLTQVLSEGEQRIIAIASFMAELRVSPSKGGIVLDDPVSSLDHKWAEKISKRLVQEGTQRQVIIFTHNIGFLLSLYRHAAIAQVPIKAQSMRRIGNLSGQCHDELPWNARNVSGRQVNLAEMALEARKSYKIDPDGEEYHMRHDRFYGMLRSTWERVVEENLLNSVVMRFDAGISTLLLRNVVVDDNDYLTVYNEMTDSSGKIDAHDHAANLHDTKHSPDDMDEALARLKSFKKQLNTRQDEASKRRKNLVKPPVV